jgi:hypothetical protein
MNTVPYGDLLGHGSGKLLWMPDAVDDEHTGRQAASSLQGLLHVDCNTGVVNLVLKHLQPGERVRQSK